MTYSNAAPRIGSANHSTNDKDKKKTMGGTFYDKSRKGSRKKSTTNNNPNHELGAGIKTQSNIANTNSDRKEIKLNNYLKH